MTPSTPPSPYITASGDLSLRPLDGAAPVVDPALAARVLAAFARGPAAGVLHLGAREVAAQLPTPFAWLRDFGRLFVARLCAMPELEDVRAKARVAPPPDDELAHVAESVPAMPGAEYVTEALLAAWWDDLHGGLAEALGAWKGTVEGWLQAQSPLWHRVGRVCFHLAERKGDPASPFAFLATYTTGVSAAGRVQHAPLGRAMKEAAETGDRARLESLLEPVRRASETVPFVKSLVDAGDIFQPLAWSASQAYSFLKVAPDCEAAGVSVRLPDWWNPRSPSRPTVRVSVGAEHQSRLTLDALLDFSVELALDDVALTAEDIATLRAAGTGLVNLRGRWVEVDAKRLEALLSKWRDVQRSAREGLSVHDALRLLAGATPSDVPAELADERAGGWVRVEPGPWLREVLQGLRDPATLGDVDPGKALTATLRPYQKLGVRWLWFLRSIGFGGCLADDMGLGKTLQVIALLLVEKKHRKGATATSLIVAPASLLANWRAELARFAPSLRVALAHPSAGAEAPPDDGRGWGLDVDVVVTSYGMVTRAVWLRERPWNLLALDEAQAIKNGDTKQTRAVKSLQAAARFALTGTPVENRLGDLWSLFDFLQPGLLGGAKEFSRYAKSLASAGSGEAYGPLRRLVGPYILRRLKTDKRVIADLPDKTEVTAWCSLTALQAKLYGEVIADLRRRLSDAADPKTRRGAVLAALMRFKQVCNHPSQLTGDGRFEARASGKYARLRELAEEIASRGEKALVFTQFQEMTGPLAAVLAEVFGASGVVLDGTVPVKQRAKLVATFQSDPAVPFFVLSLKAGGTGLTLTAAQHVIHFDRWWNPAVENQATDRAYRIGQKRNVMVHRFVCKGTLEEKIDAMLTSKRALADAVLDAPAGGEVSLTELSDDELMKVVSLDLARALDEG